MQTSPQTSRHAPRAAAALAAVAAAIVILAVFGHDGRAAGGHAHHDHATATAKPTAERFRAEMRRLWEDHITWTRLAIVSFAHDLPDLPATERRLLRNQDDIGDAIKPYYGRAAGDALTALLREHITGAVALLAAAKAGDSDATERRRAEWYVNGDEIADFLHEANPRHWPRRAMRRMMRGHLDQTLREAVHRLEGDYAADVRDYDEIHHHILRMADRISTGIIRQFPRRFR